MPRSLTLPPNLVCPSLHLKGFMPVSLCLQHWMLENIESRQSSASCCYPAGDPPCRHLMLFSTALIARSSTTTCAAYDLLT